MAWADDLFKDVKGNGKREGSEKQLLHKTSRMVDLISVLAGINEKMRRE